MKNKMYPRSDRTKWLDRRKWRKIILVIMIIAILLVAGFAFIWYMPMYRFPTYPNVTISVSEIQNNQVLGVYLVLKIDEGGLLTGVSLFNSEWLEIANITLNTEFEAQEEKDVGLKFNQTYPEQSYMWEIDGNSQIEGIDINVGSAE